jgi:fatty-acid desaturase
MIKEFILRSGNLKFYFLALICAIYFLSIEQIIIGLVLGWLFSGIGISVVLHRYVSHKSFEFKNNFYKLISYIIAFMTGYGNPVVWASIHRQHHVVPDTIDDPQSPLQLGRLRTFLSMFEVQHNVWADKQKQLLLKDKFNKFFTEYYLWLTIAYPLSLFLVFGVDVMLIFIGIVTPVCIVLQGYINAFLHDEPADENGLHSKNIKGDLFWFGENLHKSHHIHPNRAWHTDWDLGKYYIKLVGKDYNEKVSRSYTF